MFVLLPEFLEYIQDIFVAVFLGGMIGIFLKWREFFLVGVFLYGAVLYASNISKRGG